MNAGFIAYYARRYDEALALIRGVPLRFIRIPRRRFYPTQSDTWVMPMPAPVAEATILREPVARELPWIVRN